jgi:hypothetical protein
MARPTNAESEKLEKIKKLNLFTRDSHIYAEFEETKIYDDIHSWSHIFIQHCKVRTLHKTYKEKSIIDILDNGNEDLFNYFNIMSISKEELQNKLDKLKEIDIDTYTFYNNLYVSTFVNRVDSIGESDSSPLNYKINTYAYRKDIEKIFLHVYREESDFYIRQMVMFERALGANWDKLLLDDWFHVFNDEVKEFFKKYYLGQIDKLETIMESNRYSSRYNASVGSRVSIELDFRKPKEELIKIISQAKENFDKPNSLKIYKDLGLEVDISDIVTSSEIYVEDKKKSIEGKFADILFVYDCKKVGFVNDYIKEQIYNYWVDKSDGTREESITDKTIQSHNTLAKKYID